MKKVFIIHGWDGTPNEPMHKWLKKTLEEKEYIVEVPKMPNSSEPKIKSWINKLKEIVINPNDKTYFIGHSVGCQGILRYLETLDKNVKVGGVILIAPWMYLDENTIKEEGEEVIEIAKPWMETPLKWDKIKNSTNKFVCIFSDNDPYVPLTNKDLFKEKLGAEIIIEKNKGHFTESDKVFDNKTAFRKLIEISTQ
jgi:uncharacterized protein